MKRADHVTAGLAAAALVLALAATATAYQGQVLASLSVTIDAAGTCGSNPTVSATLLDAEGAPIAGEPITWALESTQSAADRVNATPTKTDASGVATTTLTLAPVSGNRTVRATAGQASAAISATGVVTHDCGGLPNTSTLAPRTATPPGGPSPFGALVVLLACVGAGLTLRRLSPTSR